MRNEERIPSPPEAALSPLGKGRSGGRLSAEVEEIASVQVLFPDRRTLDEVIAELRGKIEKLETKEGV